MNMLRFAWTAICLIIEIVLFFNLMDILFDLRAKGIVIGEAIDDPYLSRHDHITSCSLLFMFFLPGLFLNLNWNCVWFRAAFVAHSCLGGAFFYVDFSGINCPAFMSCAWPGINTNKAGKFPGLVGLGSECGGAGG